MVSDNERYSTATNWNYINWSCILPGDVNKILGYSAATTRYEGLIYVKEKNKKNIYNNRKKASICGLKQKGNYVFYMEKEKQ